MLCQQRDKLVTVEVGKIVKRQHAVLGKLQHHAKADIFEVAQILGNLKPVEGVIDPLRLALDKFDRPRLQLLGNPLVKSLDGGQLFDRRFSNFLGKDKPFGNEKMRDHIVDIEGFDEVGRPGAELFLAAFGLLGFGQNVDIPA